MSRGGRNLYPARPMGAPGAGGRNLRPRCFSTGKADKKQFQRENAAGKRGGLPKPEVRRWFEARRKVAGKRRFVGATPSVAAAFFPRTP